MRGVRVPFQTDHRFYQVMPALPKSKSALVTRKSTDSKRRKLSTAKFAKRSNVNAAQFPLFPMHKLFGRFPVPAFLWQDFTYSTVYDVVSAGASAFGNERVFRLNSCYDPDFSGAGHQPYGWDQMTTVLYSAFCVDRCTVDVEFINTSTAELVGGVEISSSSDVTQLASTSLIGAPERFNVWTCNVPTTGSQRVRFVQSFPVYLIEGLGRDEYLASPYYHGTRTADPPLCNYIRIACADYAGGAGGITMQMRISLTYHTKLFRRITAGGS